MPLTGDIKQNYHDLQQSTGERFEHMADRMLTPEVLAGLDTAGREGNRELADWLRVQSDDEEAILRHQPIDEQARAAEARSKDTKPSSTPQGRSATGNKQV
jgi:hypothetical protein